MGRRPPGFVFQEQRVNKRSSNAKISGSRSTKITSVWSSSASHAEESISPAKKLERSRVLRVVGNLVPPTSKMTRHPPNDVRARLEADIVQDHQRCVTLVLT